MRKHYISEITTLLNDCDIPLLLTILKILQKNQQQGVLNVHK